MTPNSVKKYGRCYGCGRIVPKEVLVQVDFYEDHSHEGSLHHKTLCFTCIKKANEAGKEIMKDKTNENN